MDVETPEARPRGTLVAVVRNAVRTHSGGGTQAGGVKRQRKTSNLPPNMWVAQKATKSLPAAAAAFCAANAPARKRRAEDGTAEDAPDTAPNMNEDAAEDTHNAAGAADAQDTTGDEARAAADAAEPQAEPAKKRPHRAKEPLLPHLSADFTCVDRVRVGENVKSGVFHGPIHRVEDSLDTLPDGGTRYRVSSRLSVREHITARDYARFHGYRNSAGAP